MLSLIDMGNEEKFDIAYLWVTEWAAVNATLRNHIYDIDSVIVLTENESFAYIGHFTGVNGREVIDDRDN